MSGDRAIVCVSGIGGSAAEWDAVAPALSAFGRVTPAIPREGRMIVVGHSRGGVRALTLAAGEPGRVEALVLTNGFFPPARDGRSTLAAVRDYAGHRVAYLRSFADSGRAPHPTRTGLGQLGTVARLGLRPGAFHRIADAVRCPVIVIHGRDDHVVPIGFAHAAAARHPAWTFRALAGGHRLHADRPAVWSEVVTEWLGLVETRSPQHRDALG